ncbi:hypothetical protein [uncultured Corynebacterium sp.]|uniref:hypothetical protein n=1 Tax=uncultured Corynebacterium sp. TaxID=159447 RepID=UPI0025EE2327|nr:hypothetical protein [uncultured Corynebacterium sp.]
MKSLKSAARRGVVISAAAMSALALAACSAGQVTQTSQKVVAVDGSHASTEDGAVTVADVTILVEPNTGEAALKFTAVNKGYAEGDVTLKSIDVDGQSVSVSGVQPIGREESIVADSEGNLKELAQAKMETIQYLPTTLQNEDYGYAGTRPVTFTFSNGTVEVDAPVAAAPFKSGEQNRDVQSVEGYTTEAPKAEH